MKHRNNMWLHRFACNLNEARERAGAHRTDELAWDAVMQKQAWCVRQHSNMWLFTTDKLWFHCCGHWNEEDNCLLCSRRTLTHIVWLVVTSVSCDVLCEWKLAAIVGFKHEKCEQVRGKVEECHHISWMNYPGEPGSIFSSKSHQFPKVRN